MTSKYATNAREFAQRLANSTKSQQVDKDTGTLVEGAIPFTFQRLATGAQTFDPFYAVTEIVSGTTLAVSNAMLLNSIYRTLTIKNNDLTAGVTTLTLVGGATFNNGATTIATFTSAAESCLVICVTPPLSGAIPQVHVVSSRNVVLS